MKLVKSILVVALLAVCSVSMAQQKFGVVSAQEIMIKMPEMDSVRVKLEAIEASLIADMEATQKEYQNKVQEYQKIQSTLSATMREQREKDIQSLLGRMQEFEQVAQREMQEQQTLLMAPVQKRLLDAITKVGKDNGFVFIFDKSSALFTSESLVTDATLMVTVELGIK